MPNQSQISELSSCEERERLLIEIRNAIMQTIRIRDESDAGAALKAWRTARKALMQHTEEHGC